MKSEVMILERESIFTPAPTPTDPRHSSILDRKTIQHEQHSTESMPHSKYQY